MFTIGSTMGEFVTSSGLGVVAGVGAGVSGVEGQDGADDRIVPSTSSVLSTSGTVQTMVSTPTLESSSGRSSDLDYARPSDLADEFVEVDIGEAGAGAVRGSGLISPPPHLSMSFGSWNSDNSKGRRSGISRQSSNMDPGTDPGPGSNDGGHGREEDEEQRRILRPHQNQRQWYTMENHTAATLVEAETVREHLRGHLRKRSGSPVSLALPAKGTLFIVNNRNSEDL